MSYHPSTLLERLVGGCFSLLAAALAVYVAVRLIEAVWVALLLIVLVPGLVVGLILAVRWRQQGW